MNDPTRRIDVEKSSLLSLKAELLRKQEEVLKNKNKSVPEFVKTKKLKDPSKTKIVEKGSGATVAECEDSTLFNKSRRILEAKAKYYEKMTKSKGGMNVDNHSLVQFNRKAQMDKEDSDGEDLVEYTDVFGRCRKIARKDFHKVKEQDDEMSNVVETREEQTDPNKDASDSSRSVGELSEDSDDSIVGPDIGLQFLKQRENWSKQEELNKERTSTHYQDVLFDEAREHGVAFYEFSNDHQEREKQQEALNKIREETVAKQQQRSDLKKSRDDIIANRVKLAKARVRTRLGLPPAEEKPAEDEKLFDATDRKKEKEEEAEKKKAAIEKQKERERQSHVRPWDKNKVSSKRRESSSESGEDDEVEWEPRRENHLMSQVEWNEKQREERKQEFAPISSSFVRADEVLNPRDILEEEKNEKSLMFTSKKLKRRNHSPDAPRRGAAIPPPATFDYYGPTTSKQQRTARPPPADLEASISAGLKFLREQVDKGNKHKFTAANEYTES